MEIGSPGAAHIEVGENCSLSRENRGVTAFKRVLVKSRGSGDNLLILMRDKSTTGGAINADAFHPVRVQTGSDVSRDQIDEAFANCPCKDPDSEQKAGITGCLALKSLGIEEV